MAPPLLRAAHGVLPRVIEHMLTEVVELGLHELRRQVRRRRVLVPLERLAHGRHEEIRLDRPQHRLLRGREPLRQLALHLSVPQDLVPVVVRTPEDPLQYVRDVVRLDDTPPAPQLQ